MKAILQTGMALALSAATVAVPFPAGAHHSFAMFEADKEVAVDARVKEFQWTNPHVFVEVLATEKGKMVQYSLEAGSVNGLRRRGWTRHCLKAGDKVRVIFRPFRDRTKRGGAFVRAVLPNGAALYGGAPPPGKTQAVCKA